MSVQTQALRLDDNGLGQHIFVSVHRGDITLWSSWLRGPLREWAEDLLDERALRADGLIEAGPVRAARATHLSGTANMHYPLWTVLMFQAWRQRWL